MTEIRSGRGYNPVGVLQCIRDRRLTAIAMAGEPSGGPEADRENRSVSIRWINTSCGAQTIGWGEDLPSEAFLNLCEDIEASGMTLPGAFESVRQKIGGAD